MSCWYPLKFWLIWLDQLLIIWDHYIGIPVGAASLAVPSVFSSNSDDSMVPSPGWSEGAWNRILEKGILNWMWPWPAPCFHLHSWCLSSSHGRPPMALLVLAGPGHPVLTRMSERRSSCSTSLQTSVLPHCVSILGCKLSLEQTTL